MPRNPFPALIAILFATGPASAATGKATPAPSPAPGAAAASAFSVQSSHGARGAGPGSMLETAPAKIAGTVLEHIDAGGYTYLRLKTADGEAWAAVSRAAVATGAKVTVVVQMVAEGFESKTLGRKFDRLAMGALEGDAAPAGTPANPHAGLDMSQQDQGAAAETPIQVAKAEGAEGRTVAEIWASRAALKDGKVAVRGQVAKFLPGIMGRNWIHLRDGTGSKAKGDNDVTVTTSATAAVGDVVLVKGTVRLDRDFGAGYTYPVLIEDATIEKEPAAR